MDQQTPQARPGGGTNDVTIMIVVFVLVTIGILAGFYYLMYKPKTEDIQAMNTTRDAKRNTLNQYIAEAKDLYNYYDRKKILENQWDVNKKYYVLGDAEDMDPKDVQFAIFDAYEQVFEMGDYAGVEILHLKIAEAFKYYMHDEAWELPWELLQFEWDVVFSERGGTEEGGAASTQNTTAMITAHTFSAVMRADYAGLRRFIEVVQNMEGDYKKLLSVHCFAITEEPSYSSFPVSYRGGGGGRVLTDVTIEVEMLLTFYELNEKGTAGGTPDVPGQTACSFGGGGSRGGGGGPRGAGGGTGTMSMG